MKLTANLYSQPGAYLDMDNRVAYRRAGHAAAIFLHNKQKNLPAVYFQIKINDSRQKKAKDWMGPLKHAMDSNSVIVEGGRLIENISLLFADTPRQFSYFQQEQYRCAFEADIINLLAGSLAEAKYLELRKLHKASLNATFIDALRIYCDYSDLDNISEYMECYIPNRSERDQKLEQLFLAAFNFVINRSNWAAIAGLAEYIQNSTKNILGCEEIISCLKIHSSTAARENA